MGQYYYPIILDAAGKKIVVWMGAHNYNNGAKLMEHAYIKNNFVSTFEFGLSPESVFHTSRVVWAGDYADEEEGGKTLFNQCTEYQQINPDSKDTTPYRFLLNHTKKQFVDKSKIPDVHGYRLHPLPLLTCEGNGRGGGDFRDGEPLVGSWARDVISVEKQAPEGFEEIVFDLKLGE